MALKMFTKLIILTGYDSSESLLALDSYDFEVVIPQDEALLTESSKNKLTKLLGDRVIELKYSDVNDFLCNSGAQLLCTLGWRKLIPNYVLASFKSAVNVHPALLPEYKGYHPVPYVLINNESHHGITAHLISEEVDAGPIIFREKFKIDKFSNLNDLQQQVHDMMPRFMRDLVDKLYSSDYELIDNNAADTKIIARKRIPSDSEIPLDTCLADAYDLIRSCDSERFPAYMLIEGRKVFISMTCSDFED